MRRLIDRARRERDMTERRATILEAAKRLFAERGYEAVGMRDIAREAGISPALIYREGWTKADLLAELIFSLNEQQIEASRKLDIPAGTPPLDAALTVVRTLCRFDIEHKGLRRLGAAYGWLWRPEQEERYLSQIHSLLAPVATCIQASGVDSVEARLTGIWAAYLTALRGAVMVDSDIETCVRGIEPILRLLVAPDQAGGN